MEYAIQNCDEKFFVERAEEFADLCRRSFSEHANRDVRMGPCYMTAEKWIGESTGCLGQYIEVDGHIIAFWLARPNYDKKETYGRILAVDPDYKGLHLGYSLSLSLAKYLKELGMNVFYTDTSLKAPHVVRFHKSYGCKAVGVKSWSNTNYYSVVFRLALRPDYEISDFRAKLQYVLSKIKCHLTLKEDGSYTTLAKLYRRIWR